MPNFARFARPQFSCADKKAPPPTGHPAGGGAEAFFRRSGTQLAVLSEVLNGTDHLRGVGVLVVVPRHDLNLIGVVAATLNFRTFPSGSSQFCNNSYSTTAYRCRTKTGLFVPKLYHVSASFARFPSILHPTCIFLILGSLFSRNT